MCLEEEIWDDAECIDVAQDVSFVAFVNTVTKIRAQ